MTRLSAFFVLGLLMSSPAMAAPDEILKMETPKEKTSLYALGGDAVRNLFNVGRGYGSKICEEKKVTKKEEIKTKAWAKIKNSCSRFTFGLQDNFTDHPNELFSLCIGGALDGCQKKIGVKQPCSDLTSCQALLGVPE